MKKYTLVAGDKIVMDSGVVLIRIKAEPHFRGGELGGYVQSEANLSHEGTCWIHGDAKAYGKSRVRDDASITDLAEVCQRAEVYAQAVVSGFAKVRGNAKVGGTVVLVEHQLVEGITHLK